MNKAFSLIELLVVIAIVAIITAIAVPAYQDYTFRAALSSIKSYADNVATKMIQYYDANGSFSSNLSAYGLTRVDVPATSVNQVAPNIPILTQDASGLPSTNCPHRQFMIGFAGISGDKQLPDIFGGTSTTYGKAGYLIYDLIIDASSVARRFCGYFIFENGVQFTGDTVIAGCYNYALAGVPGTQSAIAFEEFGELADACPAN